MPSVGSVKIVRVTPGNAEVLVGESVEIAAEIENPDGQAAQAWLFVAARRRARIEAADDRRQEASALQGDRAVDPQAVPLSPGDRRFADASSIRSACARSRSIESAEVTFRLPGLSRPQGRNGSPDRSWTSRRRSTRWPNCVCGLPRRWPRAIWSRAASSSPAASSDDGRLLAATMPLLKNGTYLRAAVQRRRPHRSQSAAEPHHGASRRAADGRIAQAGPPEHRRARREASTW